VPDLTILMPVYNEAATLEHALDAALRTDYGVGEVEVVVVDDGSTDATPAILAGGGWNGRVRTVAHERNAGKGAAIRTGLQAAEGAYTVILDADLEYDPGDIGKLLVPLLDGDAEVTFGVRGFASHSTYSFWYVMGNKAVTTAANVLFNSWLSDIMTCLKVMPTPLFRSLPLREPGFAIEAEITARLLRRGIRVYEVPIRYTARSREAGKKLTAVDGLRVLRTLGRCRVA
jgi:dolichol-phosphate hexosyltransferase